jgi:hypothetical protein
VGSSRTRSAARRKASAEGAEAGKGEGGPAGGAASCSPLGSAWMASSVALKSCTGDMAAACGGKGRQRPAARDYLTRARGAAS